MVGNWIGIDDPTVPYDPAHYNPPEEVFRDRKVLELQDFLDKWVPEAWGSDNPGSVRGLSSLFVGYGITVVCSFVRVKSTTCEVGRREVGFLYHSTILAGCGRMAMRSYIWGRRS